MVGFPPGIVGDGSVDVDDAAAVNGKADAQNVYNALAGLPCGTDLTGMDLGGLTLTAGVYCFSSSAMLTSSLTLNGQGSADAVFVFQIGSTLITGSGSKVVAINGVGDCNVYWQVGSSATFGSATSFLGNVFALASASFTSGATLDGRVVALNGAVTLISNAISNATCPTCETF